MILLEQVLLGQTSTPSISLATQLNHEMSLLALSSLVKSHLKSMHLIGSHNVVCTHCDYLLVYLRSSPSIIQSDLKIIQWGKATEWISSGDFQDTWPIVTTRHSYQWSLHGFVIYATFYLIEFLSSLAVIRRKRLPLTHPTPVNLAIWSVTRLSLKRWGDRFHLF